MPAVGSGRVTKSRDRRERFLAIVAEPGTLGDICEKIADGKTLLDIAQEWDVKYGAVHGWVHDERHPERLQAYAVAMEARASYTRDLVMKKLAQFAGMDLAKCYDKQGKLLPIHKMPEEVRAAMQAMEITIDARGGEKTAKIKMVDKANAVGMLARTQGMFQDKVDVKHSGTIGLADRMAKGRARVINSTAKNVSDEIPRLDE